VWSGGGLRSVERGECEVGGSNHTFMPHTLPTSTTVLYTTAARPATTPTAAAAAAAASRCHGDAVYTSAAAGRICAAQRPTVTVSNATEPR